MLEFCVQGRVAVPHIEKEMEGTPFRQKDEQRHSSWQSVHRVDGAF